MFSLSITIIIRFWEKSEIEDANYSLKYSNEDFHNGLLIVCLEAIFFIMNTSEFSFQDFVFAFPIDTLRIWEPLHDFIRNEASIPTPLKLHLLDLEIKTISKLIWEKNSTIYTTLSKIVRPDSNEKFFNDLEKENENINILKEGFNNEDFNINADLNLQVMNDQKFAFNFFYLRRFIKDY
jgi:hypothetical protein